MSRGTSKLRLGGARGGVLFSACAVIVLAVPAGAWAGENGQLLAPDAPPASAQQVPAPDDPGVAASRAPTVVVRTTAVLQTAKAPPRQQVTSVGSTAGTLRRASQPATRHSTSPIVGETSPASTPRQKAPARKTPAPSAAGGRQARPQGGPSLPQRVAAPAVMTAPLVAVSRSPGPHRGMLALAGVLLGIAALGGAVLGVGFRHSLKVRP